jgi:hypothetical protein
MTDIIKAQFEWDTLLVAGYKGNWTFSRLYAQYMKLGYTTEIANKIIRRPIGTWSRFVMRQPVSAVIANNCPEIFNLLAACKNMPDYINARNRINQSGIDFSELKKSDWSGLKEVKKELLAAKKESCANKTVLAGLYASTAKNSRTRSTNTKAGLS